MKTIVTSLLLLTISTSQAFAAGDLMVRGNIGVGTSTPDAKLDVRGGVKIGGADAVCTAATEGMVRYNSTEKRAEFCDGNGWMTVVNGAATDITDVSTDYPLKAGETAYVNYTNATTVPLHVATVEGYYQIIINSDYAAPATSSWSYFRPNNATYTNAFKVIRLAYYANTLYSQYETTSKVYAGGGVTMRSELGCFTRTKSKVVKSDFFDAENFASSYTHYTFDTHWLDTSTPWTSLGTLDFAEPQSGKVLIRRIY